MPESLLPEIRMTGFEVQIRIEVVSTDPLSAATEAWAMLRDLYEDFQGVAIHVRDEGDDREEDWCVVNLAMGESPYFLT